LQDLRPKKNVVKEELVTIATLSGLSLEQFFFFAHTTTRSFCTASYVATFQTRIMTDNDGGLTQAVQVDGMTQELEDEAFLDSSDTQVIPEQGSVIKQYMTEPGTTVTHTGIVARMVDASGMERIVPKYFFLAESSVTLGYGYNIQDLESMVTFPGMERVGMSNYALVITRSESPLMLRLWSLNSQVMTVYRGSSRKEEKIQKGEENVALYQGDEIIFRSKNESVGCYISQPPALLLLGENRARIEGNDLYRHVTEQDTKGRLSRQVSGCSWITFRMESFSNGVSGT
jgi:hypothetical protein